MTTSKEKWFELWTEFTNGQRTSEEVYAFFERERVRVVGEIASKVETLLAAANIDMRDGRWMIEQEETLKIIRSFTPQGEDK